MSGTKHPIYGDLPWHTDGMGDTLVAERSGRIVCYVSAQQTARAARIAALLAAAPMLEAALRELLAVESDDQAKGTADWCARAERAMRAARTALAPIDNPAAIASAQP